MVIAGGKAGQEHWSAVAADAVTQEGVVVDGGAGGVAVANHTGKRAVVGVP